MSAIDSADKTRKFSFDIFSLITHGSTIESAPLFSTSALGTVGISLLWLSLTLSSTELVRSEIFVDDDFKSSSFILLL